MWGFVPPAQCPLIHRMKSFNPMNNRIEKKTSVPVKYQVVQKKSGVPTIFWSRKEPRHIQKILSPKRVTVPKGGIP